MDLKSYSKIQDDMSGNESFDMACPYCAFTVKVNMTDEFVKCIRCGEIFYIEALEE